MQKLTNKRKEIFKLQTSNKLAKIDCILLNDKYRVIFTNKETVGNNNNISEKSWFSKQKAHPCNFKKS